MNKFWNVGIEIYKDGTVKAAVLRSRVTKYQPKAAYKQDHGREVFSLWFDSAAGAKSAVVEARAMSKKQEVAA